MTANSASGASPWRAFAILTRVQLKSGLSSLGTGGRGVARGIGQALSYLLLAALGAFMAASLGVVLAAVDSALVPGGAVLVAFIATLLLTFRSACGSIFGFRDYDQVMSLPVPTWVVVLSRVCALFAGQVAVSAVVMVPMYALAGLFVPLGVTQYVTAAVTVVFASAIPVSIMVFLAFGITVAASRFAYSNTVYLVLSLAVLVAGMVASFAVSGSAGATDADIDLFARAFSGVIAVYAPAAWAGAAWGGDLIWLVPFCLVSVGSVVLCVAVLSRNFMGINAALAGRASARRVDIGNVAGHQRGPLAAMVIKELRCVLDTPVYALNAIGNDVLMLLAAVALAVVGRQGAIDAVTGGDLDLGGAASFAQLSEVVLPWALAFMASAATSASAAVSMEGGSAWFMATAPVPRRTVLASKVLASAVHAVPVLAVSLVIMAMTGVLAPVSALLAFLLGASAQLLSCCLGLMLDVSSPRFDWIRPVEVCKSGRPVLAVAACSIVIAFGGGALSVLAFLSFGQLAAYGAMLLAAALLAVLASACFTRAKNGTLVPGETVPPRP